MPQSPTQAQPPLYERLQELRRAINAVHCSTQEAAQLQLTEIRWLISQLRDEVNNEASEYSLHPNSPNMQELLCPYRKTG